MNNEQIQNILKGGSSYADNRQMLPQTGSKISQQPFPMCDVKSIVANDIQRIQ